MSHTLTRRSFLNSMIAATAAANRRYRMPGTKNKRDVLLELLKGNQDYVPAAFFIHFDKAFHFGQAAVEKHLEYFKYTDMDFVKIQYERTFPPIPDIKQPGDWKKIPRYGLDFYEPELEAVKGLVKGAKAEALVLVTLYSTFMCAGHTAGMPLLTAHLHENPEQVKRGFEVITESLMLFVKECVRLGVDGFYASTQGGEAGRLRDPGLFKEYIKPFDLRLMNEINRACTFNILHVCDYHGPYADLSPYVDYPGHVVNCNPQLTASRLTWKEISRMFKRPCMGGMDRHGIIVSGSKGEIKSAVERELSEASSPFILGADCTLPNDVQWENIRAAIDAAHKFKANRA
ncbi:MAG TPA: uroporphyrinogen decarboxylase family protein [Acidobacteriota bacterium]|nr:uroporphyrinogen decarboxylase family protein [Acidobacteriota bacterium]